MSIKAVKEHFSEHFSNSVISRHWSYHFYNSDEINSVESEFQELKFRKFSIEDTDKCVKLFKEVFSNYPWYDNWISEDMAKDYLTELIKNPVFEGFIAYEGLKVVAACFGHKRSWWMGNEFFIDEFFVAGIKQGNGIGTKLMNYVKNSLIKDDCRRLILLTNKEIPAEEFYIKNGFYTNKNRIIMINEL